MIRTLDAAEQQMVNSCEVGDQPFTLNSDKKFTLQACQEQFVDIQAKDMSIQFKPKQNSKKMCTSKLICERALVWGRKTVPDSSYRSCGQTRDTVEFDSKLTP